MAEQIKPIETEQGRGRCAGAELCPLSRVPVGATVCIKALAAAPEVRERLRAMGLSEKRELRVLSRDANFVCEICDAKLDLNAELAEAILVELPVLPARQLENFIVGVATASPVRRRWRMALGALAVLGAALVTALLVWQGITAGGNPNPSGPNVRPVAATLDIGVLVFREGLESILVLAAVIASMTGRRQVLRRPIVGGAFTAFLATLATWFIAVGIVTGLGRNVSALNLQAATGLLAVMVLLVVMNWFFHKIYWGGWIAMHNRNKKRLLASASESAISERRLWWGLVLLGFASLYREGFEVVLFLQTYFLQMGGRIVLAGAMLGLFFTGIVALLTFIAHQRLPYRKMLVSTGILLGGVLLVMVGEQAQEMQLAGWIRTTPIPGLERAIPGWAGLWFSVFPTVQTLLAQGLALLVVVGSYFAARRQSAKLRREEALASTV
ncbi:MAG: FeoA domain-containing protein [Verrucomicrobia bacterium]|nr:FeoA domain-containing protein [Verrucomicrobiota bacterium]MDE3098132.1 FeoA domain-containing protein [Verrucomicrobiota bacterium]